ILDYVYLVVFGVTIHCKHSPSCSEYTIRAITRHGTIKGTFLGVKRILTCW
ncbi:membrane protein insertion efficiency factor YidD, partial [Candidatus Woesebacteria bacterium]|nr:membrane protein insertion efficiency factor YidD [Candidatus Woesebacteria bacterium]